MQLDLISTGLNNVEYMYLAVINLAHQSSWKPVNTVKHKNINFWHIIKQTGNIKMK